ncbi:MAG: heavy metal-responsive transcriptional regulator [Demequina sp.]|uniref:heavy metal-responsive transcriptional regulator n=1 Tax=Demequina sp. TaxID=2050685 RepID=UPI00198FCA5C|nr:heavy metal-responsive transcriptional regulator [Demequina sp.]MBC7299170.1 heavy metal-responsive transcriptional regulator [Demequina sp.]
MLIGELADAVGVTSQTIRFYEREGLLPEPQRAANGYRDYDDASVSRALFIRSAQSAGLTLAEIGSVIEVRDGGDVPCHHVIALLGSKLATVRARQAELAALEAELEHLIVRGNALDPADCADSRVCSILAAPLPHEYLH